MLFDARPFILASWCFWFSWLPSWADIIGAGIDCGRYCVKEIGFNLLSCELGVIPVGLLCPVCLLELPSASDGFTWRRPFCWFCCYWSCSVATNSEIGRWREPFGEFLVKRFSTEGSLLSFIAGEAVIDWSPTFDSIGERPSYSCYWETGYDDEPCRGCRYFYSSIEGAVRLS